MRSKAVVLDLPMELRDLVDAATKARERAYAPYSRFRVGAAVLGASGNVYIGCNIENSSYGATICAERVGLASGVASGETEFTAIALVADIDEPLSPCGICRQVISEIAPRVKIVMANLEGHVLTSSSSELLPLPFILPA